MTTGESARPDSTSGETTLRVSHVADYYRRYPGEPVTFYTRVDAGKAVRRFKLQVWLPVGLVVDDCRQQGDPPLIAQGPEGSFVIWRVDSDDRTSGCDEYEVHAHLTVPDPLHPRLQPLPPSVECQALVTASVDGEELSDQETVAVAIETAAQSLAYLPSIYREDDLMGRFLMLFESFWRPVEQQIDVLDLYFDPRFSPPSLLPWLASWIDLVLDERWPEERRRRLLHSAVALYRRRGTRPGLEEYLEIYTGQKPRIIEHRAHNLRLGSEARLGPGVALGTVNVPHTFTVILRLPSLEHVKGKTERARQERERRQHIEAIIQAEKPAHTSFLLTIEEEG